MSAPYCIEILVCGHDAVTWAVYVSSMAVHGRLFCPGGNSRLVNRDPLAIIVYAVRVRFEVVEYTVAVRFIGSMTKYSSHSKLPRMVNRHPPCNRTSGSRTGPSNLSVTGASAYPLFTACRANVPPVRATLIGTRIGARNPPDAPAATPSVVDSRSDE